MDSGCGNYEQFWVTNTLRGMAGIFYCVIFKEIIVS